MTNELKKTIKESIDLKKKIFKQHKNINECISLIYKTIKNKKKVLICGNGGSAADAQHLAAEFLIRLTSDVNRQSIPAISLAQDTSTLTACINDYGPDDIFKRVFTAMCANEDVLLAITTSGNSNNILEVLKEARNRGIFTLGFLGNGGGEALSYCDLAFVVPSSVTARIQECHITAGHALLQYIEDSLLEKGWLTRE